MKRREWRYWFGFFWLPFVTVLLLLCTEVNVSRNGGDHLEYGRSEPGDLLVSVSVKEEDLPVFEVLAGLALSYDEQSFWALDASAAKVYRFGLDGRLLGEMGRQGRGPGEMESPNSLHAVPDGVWVLDPGSQRAVLWGTNGNVLSNILLNETVVGLVFVPVADGIVMPVAGHPRGQQPEALFSYISSTGVSPISLDSSMADHLGVPNDDYAERLFGLKLALTRDSEVTIVRNESDDLRAWQMTLDADARRVAELFELHVPGQVLAVAKRLQQAMGAELGDGMSWRPVSGVRTVGGKTWVTANFGKELLAFSLPHGPRAELVYSGDALYEKLGVDPAVIDAIILEDRIIVASRTGIFILERVDAIRPH